VVAIGLGFTSDWIKKKRSASILSQWCGVVIRDQLLFDTQIKPTLNGPFSFLSLQAGLDLLSVGHMLADVVAIIGKFCCHQNAIAVYSRKKSIISLSRNLDSFETDVCFVD